MIPGSLVCYNWIGVKPVDGTKRESVRYWGENEVSPLGNSSQLAMSLCRSASQVTGPVSRWSWYDDLVASRRKWDQVLELRRKFGKIYPELRKRIRS